MLMLVFHEKRYKKPFGFYAAVALLAFTSSYGIIMSFSILVVEIMVFYKAFKDKDFADKRKAFVFFFLFGFMCLLAIISMFPPDGIYVPTGQTDSFFGYITSTFLFDVGYLWLKVIFCVIFFVFAVLFFGKKSLLAAIYLLPIICFISFFYSRVWHLSNLFLYSIAVMIMLKPDKETIKPMRRRIITVVSICILSIQVICSGISIYSDYNYSYSGSLKAAEFLKQYIDNGYTVFAADYNGTSLQPYFNNNIFANHSGTNGYYIWSVNSGYNDIYEDDFDYSGTFDEDIIVSKYSDDYNFSGYTPYVFEGEMFYKTGVAQSTSIMVWLKDSVFA